MYPKKSFLELKRFHEQVSIKKQHFRNWVWYLPTFKFEEVVGVEIFTLRFILEKTWNNFKCEWSIFASVWKWSFTFVSTVSKLLTMSYSFLNFRLYLVMLEGSGIINIFFTIIKLFSFIKFRMPTAFMATFPIFFTVTDLWHRLTDSIKKLFTIFVSSHLIAYLTD